MAIRIEADFISPNDIALTGRGGKAVHGLFLQCVSELDTLMAETFHTNTGTKPFTSAFFGKTIRKKSRWIFPGNTMFTIVITGLNQETEQAIAIAGARMAGQPESVRFSGAEEIYPVGDGIRMIQQPVTELMEIARPVNTITLEFLTPTAFRQRGTQMLFPQPDNVFESLAKKWNHFAGFFRLPDLSLILAEVRVQQYDLRTVMLEFIGFRQIGFIGHVTYDLRRLIPQQQRFVYLMGLWANYAGIGAKTTMGMGQCRMVQ
jgi:CRISPR-associated endoribonuclease Cas6